MGVSCCCAGAGGIGFCFFVLLCHQHLCFGHGIGVVVLAVTLYVWCLGCLLVGGILFYCVVPSVLLHCCCYIVLEIGHVIVSCWCIIPMHWDSSSDLGYMTVGIYRVLVVVW